MNVVLGITIYYDKIVLYDFSINGHGVAEIPILKSDYSLWEATEKAIIEAVKKIPNQVAEVLSHPEATRLRFKERIGTQGSALDYIALANLSRLSKNYPEAIAAAKRAIELKPNNSAAYAVLGLIYKEQGSYKEAENNFKKAIELDPKLGHPYDQLAELYWVNENYERAIEVWKKYLEIDKDNLYALSWLAYSYIHTGDYKEAVNISNRVIDLNTKTGIGVIIIVENYPVVQSIIERGPAERAGLKVGDKIIEVNGQSTKGWDPNKVVHNLKGPEGTTVKIKIERNGQDKPLEFVITREKIIDKKSAHEFAKRAFAYRELGQRDAFLKDAEQAYLLNPNDSWAKSAMAVLLIDKGNYDQALKILSTVKGSDFDKVLEAIAYAKAGDFSNAVRIYQDIPEDYLQTKSKFRKSYIAPLQNALKPHKDSRLQVARDFERKGQYKEAIKEYAEYLRLADEKEAKEVRAHLAELMIRFPHLFTLPEEAKKVVIRAEIYISEGKFERAIEEYKNALKLQPFFPALYKALALTYAQLKDYKKAIRNMNIYLELYPDAPDARLARDNIYRWEFLMEKGE